MEGIRAQFIPISFVTIAVLQHYWPQVHLGYIVYTYQTSVAREYYIIINMIIIIIEEHKDETDWSETNADLLSMSIATR